jgi:hypothetical protein
MNKAHLFNLLYMISTVNNILRLKINRHLNKNATCINKFYLFFFFFFEMFNK